ncbi:MAG: stage IV sporulation protein A [Oscillospiraceae bacterium]
MDFNSIYKDIATRTNGTVFLGCVGPVRTGKSTFIKRFMELMVLPQIKGEAFSQRARDELPQSAAGRTIMTTEPKFVPEQAVTIELDSGVSFKTRLIDCVGYMVQGAMGHEEDDKPRMVKSPWFEEDVSFDIAAETGTRKVITDHSTIGIIITTDGSISDIPRAQYEAAEERVAEELAKTGKPYIFLLNCVTPNSPKSIALAAELSEKYSRVVMPISCVDLTEETVLEILKSVLYEFPIKELSVSMPKWVTMLDTGHWLQSAVYNAVREYAANTTIMKHLVDENNIIECEFLQGSRLCEIELGTGCACIELNLQNDIFYKILGETTGLEICDEASLMPCIINLAKIKTQYEKIRSAMEQVQATGYGIVMPSINELRLEDPEIVKQGGRYGVRLRASAPSIHIVCIKKKFQFKVQQGMCHQNIKSYIC